MVGNPAAPAIAPDRLTIIRHEAHTLKLRGLQLHPWPGYHSISRVSAAELWCEELGTLTKGVQESCGSQEFARRRRLISAHAPHNENSDVDKDKFGDSRARVIWKRMSEDDALNFLLIDAYVRCAPTERNSIGNAEPDDTNDNSTKFTATIAAEGLTVANTDSPLEPRGPRRNDHKQESTTLLFLTPSCHTPCLVMVG